MLNYHTEKYGDWDIYPKSLAYENPKSANKYTLKSSLNFKPSIHNVLVQELRKKMWLSMCLLVVLGSQGIEEKCTAAILDLTVHFIT